MFKKLTGVLVVVAGLASAFLLGVEETNAKPSVRVKSEEVVVSNVGDGQEYAYEITNINEVEVHGVPLNKESYTNRGIFLYKEDIGFEVELGDKIVVVWGEYEDEFKLIDRAVELENGEYVSQTKLRNVESLIDELRVNKLELAKF